VVDRRLIVAAEGEAPPSVTDESIRVDRSEYRALYGLGLVRVDLRVQVRRRTVVTGYSEPTRPAPTLPTRPTTSDPDATG
jgi:hypothetical protein